MLGVRKSTSNLVCYAEAGYPSLQDLVKFKQHKFFHRMWDERSEIQDDPLAFAIRAACDSNTHTGKIAKKMIRDEVVDMSKLLENVRNAVVASNTSRCVIYKDINPDLSVHDVYKEKHIINEFHRMSFTRFRVSGHSLAVETGRWNRRGRGRLPIEERLCVCGLVQTERHVVETCPLTDDIRRNHNIARLEDLFTDCMSNETTCTVIHEILELYK